jgi:hypothetical protein
MTRNETASKKSAQVSRQTLWQRRHREMGLCVVCSEPAFKGWRCVKHYEQHKINMRFRYIPRVRGRYNVGGTTTTPGRAPRAEVGRKSSAAHVRAGGSGRSRGAKTHARYAKA